MLSVVWPRMVAGWTETALDAHTVRSRSRLPMEVSTAAIDTSITP